MANWIPSALSAAQAKLSGAFAASEMRFRSPVTHMEFLRQSEIMIPGYQGLKTATNRTINTYFKDRTSRSLGSARAHDHSGAKSDTTVFTPTWATKSDKFNISLKQGNNNIFSREEMLAHEVQNAMINMVNEMDADAETHIFSNRSGVNVATQQGSFDATDDTFEITESSEGDRAMQITQTVMDTNGHSGPITIFADSIAYDKFEKQRFQGAGNSDNLSFQFGNAKIVHSLGLGSKFAGLVSAYSKGSWIAVVDGTIAALPWIPVQNRIGVVTSENVYGSIKNPIDGLTYATHSYDTRSDQSAVGGQLQDVLTEMEISVDVALDNAPLNTATESTLLAFALV
ncbi:MAG: hypothetical protein CMI54_06175 [Parcubacteria group bacterium]|jgi:hypothetical protein|nr:hypothetical protein [Parcubacteria group bacterium]|tara:strand:+ start:2074 stop:3099 length:1026 start_codon:yes stop_codon:yes gene_type:complete